MAHRVHEGNHLNNSEIFEKHEFMPLKEGSWR
jgi:hypothetical protein